MTFPNSYLLLAQETTPPAGGAPEGATAGDGAAQPSPPPMWPVFMLMLVVMYFVMIRPQQKRAKEQKQRVDSLKIGSKIISAGGIHGLVTNVGDKTVTVKVSDNSKIKFEKSSIVQVFASDKNDGGKQIAADDQAQDSDGYADTKD